VEQDQDPGRQRAELVAEIAARREEAARLGRPTEAADHFRQLEGRVREEGLLPVIVRVRATFQPELTLQRAVEVEAQRALITEAQQDVVESLVGYDPVSIKRFQYIPYMVVWVNGTGLASLRSGEGVLDVQEDLLSPMSLSQSTELIGATRLAAAGVTGQGQTVAILDSGVDKTHPFLADKVVAEACFSTNSTANSIFSLCPGGVTTTTAPDSGLPCGLTGVGCEHGTHVAGIVAGKGTTFSGVARDAKLIAVQVFSRLDNPSSCQGNKPSCVVSYDSDIIRALEEVYRLRTLHSIAAVNLSLGGGQFSSNCDRAEGAMKAAIDLLRGAGIASVVASGNSGYTDALSSPACISTAISVGSMSDSTNQVSRFSNTASFLHLLAPGEGIISSVPAARYGSASGTSMAAPHVAGAWALARQAVPTASVTQILEAMTSTGVAVTDTRVNLTKPRLQIDAAVDLLRSGSSTSDRPQAPASLTATARGETQIDLSWQDRSTNEAGFRIRRQNGGTGSWLTVATVAANQTSWSNLRLVTGVTYKYQVVAFNAQGESPPSNEASATTAIALPSAPTGLTASAVSGTQIDLAWRDNAGNETGYRIERRDAGGSQWAEIGTVAQNVTVYRQTGLTAGATYHYRVLAYNAAGNSAPSNEVSATLPTVPTAPTNLTARATSSTQIELTWRDNATNESGFSLERKTGTTGAWTEISRLAPNTTQVVNRGLRARTVYLYRVRAFNSAGFSAWSNEATPTTGGGSGGGTVAQPSLNPPSSLQVTALSVDRVGLAWLDNATQETGILVQRRADGETAWRQVATLPPNTTSYQEAGLVPGGLQSYRVLAVDQAGSQAASDPVAVRLPTTPFRPLANEEVHQTTVAGGQSVFYRLYIPEGTTRLLVQTRGSGDVDLYLRPGSQPTQSTFHCRSIFFTSNELCVVSSPAAGDWHIMVYGYARAASSFLVTATHAGGTTLLPTQALPVAMIQPQEADNLGTANSVSRSPR
jgi:subtilisin family serine protease